MVIWWYIPDILCSFVQDTALIIPPYPYNLEEDHHDVALEDMWYARPQLYFTCALRPKNGRKPKNANYKTGPDDKTYSFIFFSTFEVLQYNFISISIRYDTISCHLSARNTRYVLK